MILSVGLLPQDEFHLQLQSRLHSYKPKVIFTLKADPSFHIYGVVLTARGLGRSKHLLRAGWWGLWQGFLGASKIGDTRTSYYPCPCPWREVLFLTWDLCLQKQAKITWEQMVVKGISPDLRLPLKIMAAVDHGRAALNSPLSVLKFGQKSLWMTSNCLPWSLQHLRALWESSLQD